MKRALIFLILAALLPVCVFGQKTVNVAKGGTLASLISEDEKYSIEILKVTGELNGDDIALLRDMAGNNASGELTEGILYSLDLSKAKIVEGGGRYIDATLIQMEAGAKISSETGFHFSTQNDVFPQWAFTGCARLRSISLPKDIIEIGEYAFYNGNLEEVIIPKSVQNIGTSAFYNNGWLSKITLPATLQSLGNNSFRYCSGLTEIHANMLEPFAITNNTFSVYDKATLYVPSGTKALYEATETWNKFKSMVEMSDETISISDLGKSTYCSNNDLDFSEFGDDLKAYVATGYDPDSKTIWMTRVTDVPAGTGIFLKGKKGDYQVPAKHSTSYYKNMLVGTLSSTDIPSSTSDYTNLYLAKDGGELKFCTIAGDGRTMGANKAYLQIPKTFKSRPTSATAATESIKLTEGKSTYCSSNDLDFTSMGDALKAYIATGYTNSTGTIWMTRVYDVPAGTGIFLKGENKTHSVPTKVKGGTSQYESYLVNMLVGTLTKTYIASTTDTYKNMYLTKENGVLKFCGISGDGRDMNANRAYLQVPLEVMSKTRSTSYDETSYKPEFCEDVIGIPVVFGTPTSIKKVASEEAEGDNVWYNLNGQRVDNPGKGIYIRNGRKVVIK